MTAQDILKEIKPLGTESYRKVLRNHGVRDPFFGVKIEDLKKIQRRVKKDYQLALDLYDTGVYDAMYLAGLVADDDRMTKKDLQHWIDGAYCGALSEYTVPWVAAEGRYGRELGMKWIESRKERESAAGWSTLGSLLAVKEDAEIDMTEMKRLLQRVQKSIHEEPNRVRYVMNGFVIAAGTYARPLTDLAVQTAERIGRITVDMGGTACKVPYAPEYIEKVRKRGSIGKKRKTVKC